jgi:threonine dehydratase
MTEYKNSLPSSSLFDHPWGQTLFSQILQARTRVYKVGTPTPLQKLTVQDAKCDIFIKREDLSPIHAYKWRGAYNATSHYVEKTNTKLVVAASAGNHAQGVALAARLLGIQAKIFMPLATPMMKQKAVKHHGQDHVEILLVGDNYDQAFQASKDYCAEHQATYIHPFDDLYTIAGQATIADEIILSGHDPFDAIFVQIGGGGMAAGLSSWIKLHHPSTKIIGVEGSGQASMKASLDANRIVTLDSVDTFCDGTAVKTPGALTFEICQSCLDEIITVTNEEVCAAIQQCWDNVRAIPEPSGAMSLAGLIQYTKKQQQDSERPKRYLAILCGANMDFGKLALISSQSAIGSHRRCYLRLTLDETSGSLLHFLEDMLADVNVTEFQYGKINAQTGHPVLAFEASAERIQTLQQDIEAKGYRVEDITGQADCRYRIINYNPASFLNPLFYHVHFPERQGALREFMRQISDVANVCYFNYAYTGESIGRAIMGFEFQTLDQQRIFLNLLQNTHVTCRPLEGEAQNRILAV